MSAAARGWLLLCADLADGARPLTSAQLRELRLHLRRSERRTDDPDRPLRVEDLRLAGLDEEGAARVLALLERETALDAYLESARIFGIRPLTLADPEYPARLRRRLGLDAPPVLFCRGNLGLLSRPTVSLTGSRVLDEASEAFATAVGRLAAKEGKVLVSGNAVGADCAAQSACLQSGGAIVAVVPGELENCVPKTDRELYLCQTGWHLPFTVWRALERNRLIYALSGHALIARSGVRGGTFSGASDALARGLCPVSVRDDGSAGSRALIALGASPVQTLSSLDPPPAAQLPLPD